MKKNRNLALAALALASLALIAGESSRRVSIDPTEIARRIQSEADHVETFELSQWIASGKENLRIIDLRSPVEFAAYHIPGAENLSLTELMEQNFPRNETIVVYSDGGVHSAQAVFLLWTLGHKNAFTLKGGLIAWEAEILKKKTPVNPSPPDSSLSNKPPLNKPHLRDEEKFRREC